MSEQVQVSTQPTVEAVAEVLWNLDRKRYDWVYDWAQVNDPTVELYDLGDDSREEARAVLALLPGRPESVVKAEALREAAEDLLVRLNRANKGLLSQSRTDVDSERIRLEGKAEGVRLAASYVEEIVRLNRDLTSDRIEAGA